MLVRTLQSTGPSVSASYVGGTTLASIGTTANINVSLTSLVNGSDTSPSAGDLVVVYLTIAAAGLSAPYSKTVTGYTNLVSILSNGVNDTSLSVHYKFLTGADTSLIIEGGNNNISNSSVAVVHVFRNVPQTTPSYTTVNLTASLLFTPPTISLSSPSVVIAGGGSASTAANRVYTAAIPGFISDGANDTYDANAGAGYKFSSSASVSFDQVTFSSADSTNYSSCAVTVAFSASVPAPVPFDLTYVTETYSLSNATTLTLPSGIEAGDLIVVSNFDYSTTTVRATSISGYTRLLTYDYSTYQGLCVFIKVADGTESGTTITVMSTTSSSYGGASCIVLRPTYRIAVFAGNLLTTVGGSTSPFSAALSSTTLSSQFGSSTALVLGGSISINGTLVDTYTGFDAVYPMEYSNSSNDLAYAVYVENTTDVSVISTTTGKFQAEWALAVEVY